MRYDSPALANTLPIHSWINVASAYDAADCLVAKMLRGGEECSYRKSTRRLYF